MNILLTNFHPYDGGGHTTYILEIVRSLATQENITIAAPVTSKLNRLARSMSGKITVLDLEFPGKIKELGAVLINTSRARSIINQGHFDVIHVNGSPDHKLMLYAKSLSNKNPKIVFTKHNSYPIKTSAALRLRYCTDHVIAVSAHTAEQVLAITAEHTEVSLIRNGVDTQHYAPYSAQASSALRERFLQGKCVTNPLIFVSVAGTAQHKGRHLLVAAVARLPDKVRSRIFIVVCGKQISKQNYKTYVEELNMQENVLFPGYLDDVRDFIGLADVGFVLSTDVETISLACREMMAMAKPVLVSDFSGLRENICDDVDGWISAKGDISSIEIKVGLIVAEQNRLGMMGLRAREKAVSDFGADEFARKTADVYRHVCRLNPPS